MKFAVMMLLAGAVSASSQVAAPESQSMWSVSMDNAKFKELQAEDRALGQEMEKFYNNHPNVKLEAKKLGKVLHQRMQKLQVRLEKTGKMLDSPKYQAELNEIGAKMHALDLKIKKALKWDAQGLKMWKLHMDNDKFKEIVADDKAIGEDMKKFVASHPKINKEYHDLVADINLEFQQIGQRLEQTGQMLSDPKYKAELAAIHKKWAALDAKFKANLHWDDEGLKMWKLSMDPKVQQQIDRQAADIARDIDSLKHNQRRLDMEIYRYERDQERNFMDIQVRFDQMIRKLDTPKHRAQLQKIHARWEALEMYKQKEERAIGMELEKFLKQPEVQAELRDAGSDIEEEINDISDRYQKLGRDIELKHGPGFERKFNIIGRKLRALKWKFERNLKFDPETRMWKISMDNDDAAELEKMDAEIKQDIEKFVAKHKDVAEEVRELQGDLMEEMHDIEEELKESAKLLEDPKYQAELEAIGAKMKALDAKFKASIKFEE